MTENLWLILVAGGPAVIAVALAFALFRRRKRSPTERAATERATAKLYDPEDRGKEP